MKEYSIEEAGRSPSRQGVGDGETASGSETKWGAFPVSEGGQSHHDLDFSNVEAAELALRESEERFRILVEGTGDVLYRLGFDSMVYDYVNPAIEKLTGYTPSEINAVGFSRLVRRIEVPGAGVIDASSLARERLEGRTGEFLADYLIRTKDGCFKWVRDHSMPWVDGTGKVVGSVGVLVDITERKRTEEALLRSQRELLLRDRISSVFLTHADNEMVDGIRKVAMEALESPFCVLGYLDRDASFVVWPMGSGPCRQGRSGGGSIPRTIWEKTLWGEALKDNGILVLNEPCAVPDGHVPIDRMLAAPFLHRGEAVGMLMAANKPVPYTEDDRRIAEVIAGKAGPILRARFERDREERERKLAEEQLRQAQKMEAIGTLAGGIAHDFNNILSAILGHTELALMNEGSGKSSSHHLEQVRDSALRARELVRQILLFSRQGDTHSRPVRIFTIVLETLQLLRSTIPANVDVRLDLQSDACVHADPTQIYQIVMNLCTNAFHAMRRTGGILDVRLTDVESEAADTPAHLAQDPGPYVRLSIEDTGHGIDPAILKRIFDPFFTTKGPGEGTGMGLAVVHGIVEKHGGAVVASSRPDEGSLFEVYLPRLEECAEERDDALSEAPRGVGCILFVDDEKAVTHLAKQMLEGLGYEVDAFTDVREGLETFLLEPGRYDLVITDHAMPRMTGVELAREILRVHPDLPVILCTGFNECVTEGHSGCVGIAEVMTKPFTRLVLARTVRKALESRLAGS